MAENEESTDTPQAGSATPAESAAESTVPASDTAKPAEAAVARNVSSSPPRSSSGYGGGASRGGRPDSRGRSGGGGGGGAGAGGRRFFRRRKVDFFSANKVDDINYKDADTLRQFIGDRGKILPRRHTGLSAQHQRLLKKAIKRARNIALLPFAGPGRPTGGGRSGPRAASRQE
ncbi:MAG: 30S ribosomal protein S18 [Acidobacteria bacterium]|nr:30S ribosomal protein S18 [Acidobacteriota bacterium]